MSSADFTGLRGKIRDALEPVPPVGKGVDALEQLIAEHRQSMRGLSLTVPAAATLLAAIGFLIGPSAGRPDIVALLAGFGLAVYAFAKPDLRQVGEADIDKAWSKSGERPLPGANVLKIKSLADAEAKVFDRVVHLTGALLIFGAGMAKIFGWF